MPGAARLGDKAQVQADAHGCPACPHPGTGPIVVASTNVFVNSKGAARKKDLGIHAACCGPNPDSCCRSGWPGTSATGLSAPPTVSLACFLKPRASANRASMIRLPWRAYCLTHAVLAGFPRQRWSTR